jgi:hypothetical protein
MLRVTVLRGPIATAVASLLVTGSAGQSPDETAAADDALHELERRVYDVEQRCAR